MSMDWGCGKTLRPTSLVVKAVPVGAGAPRDGPASPGTREVLEQSINIRAALRSLPFALKNRSSVFAADALATAHRGQCRSGTGGPENETASARRRGAPFGECRDEILPSADYCWRRDASVGCYQLSCR